MLPEYFGSLKITHRETKADPSAPLFPLELAPVEALEDGLGGFGVHVQLLLRIHPGQDLEFRQLDDFLHLGFFQTDLLFPLMLGGQIDGDALTAVHAFELLPVGGHLLGQRQELFLLLRAYYTNEELASFFFPLLGENLDFKNWIRMNYQLFLPIKDFAAMANMSVDTFKRTFKKEFGMPIHKWLTEQKAHLVCRDIMLGKHTLAEIADRYRFSSQAYLCTFCKTHLGKTPQELRTQQPGHPFLAL